MKNYLIGIRRIQLYYFNTVVFKYFLENTKSLIPLSKHYVVSLIKLSVFYNFLYETYLDLLIFSS